MIEFPEFLRFKLGDPIEAFIKWITINYGFFLME